MIKLNEININSYVNEIWVTKCKCHIYSLHNCYAVELFGDLLGVIIFFLNPFSCVLILLQFSGWEVMVICF